MKSIINLIFIIPVLMYTSTPHERPLLARIQRVHKCKNRQELERYYGVNLTRGRGKDVQSPTESVKKSS